MANWDQFKHGQVNQVADGAYAEMQVGGWGFNNTAVVVSGGQTLMIDTTADIPMTTRMLDGFAAADPAAKKIDLEAWFPAQERYREVTSCSNTTDFQARRLGIRFRGEEGLETPHTLNGTVVTDRALLAILENLQGEVPDVLRAYGAPERVSG